MRALAGGFVFKFPNLGTALEHLSGHAANVGTNSTSALAHWARSRTRRPITAR
jgi:hypothetical protein